MSTCITLGLQREGNFLPCYIAYTLLLSLLIRFFRVRGGL